MCSQLTRQGSAGVDAGAVPTKREISKGVWGVLKEGGWRGCLGGSGVASGVSFLALHGCSRGSARGDCPGSAAELTVDVKRRRKMMRMVRESARG